jgi:hypothetical protein
METAGIKLSPDYKKNTDMSSDNVDATPSNETNPLCINTRKEIAERRIAYFDNKITKQTIPNQAHANKRETRLKSNMTKEKEHEQYLKDLMN